MPDILSSTLGLAIAADGGEHFGLQTPDECQTHEPSPGRLGMSDSNLEDRASIHDLFTRYCCALDNGEVETVVDCFTVDAILKSPVIDISGHDEIRAFAGRFAAQRAAGTQFRHMVSNISVTITGNRAAASAYLLVVISKDGNHHSLPPGRYVCEVIKDGSGQWRFSRRTVSHDHDYRLDGIDR
jgi:ketosteroid isomerase-like protein